MEKEPLYTKTDNIKNLTGLKVFEEHNRLITSSLDAHIKVYELGSLKLLHQTKYGHPVTAFDVSADLSHLAVGLANGTFQLSKNKSKEVAVYRQKHNDLVLGLARRSESLSFKYFNRGIYSKEKEADAYSIELIKAVKLSRYDNQLK